MFSISFIRNPVPLSLAVVLVGAVISFGIVVSAQTNDPLSDIEYPIAELGGCESEEECMAYCEEIEHIDECIAFAEAHDLLPPEEIEEAKKFAAAGGTGPGECSSRESCEAYCTDINHIEECVAFGEAHDLIPDDKLQEAKRVALALREGAVLPGGCTSKDSCEAYCSDPTHIEECLAFAEAAGFMEGEELEEARKFLEFIQAGGETPGECRGERECREYCENPDHVLECIDFAERLGVISPEEAELVRKTGGVGPGGCRGKEECDAFCNTPENQETCFAFAREHDLVSEEDLEHAREGFNHLREGLFQAPEEVRVCIKESVGSEILAKIESGEPFTPSPDLGEKIRHCFETVGPPPDELINTIEQAPPEVRSCIETKLGADIVERLRSEGITALAGEGDVGETIFACFREFGDFGEDFEGGFEAGPSGSTSFDIFEDADPAVLGCLSNELGFNRFRELRDTDTAPTHDDLAAVRHCFESTGSQTPESLEHDLAPTNFDGEHDEFFDSTRSDFAFPPVPPEARECVLRKLGADFEERLRAGKLDPSTIEPVIRVCLEEYERQRIESQIRSDIEERFEEQFRDEYDGSFDESFIPEEFDNGTIYNREVDEQATDEPTLDGSFDYSLPPISPEVEHCVAAKLGADYRERLFAGTLAPDVIEPAIRACTEEILQSDALQSQNGFLTFMANAWNAILGLFQ